MPSLRDWDLLVTLHHFARDAVLTQRTEAREEAKDFIAALKTLRHPKSVFFSKVLSRCDGAGEELVIAQAHGLKAL